MIVNGKFFPEMLILVLLLVSFKTNANSEPLQIVESLHQALLNVMRMSDEKSFTERYSYLKPTVSESFDFNKIARLVTGRYWRTALQSEREDFEKSLLNTATYNYVLNFNENSNHQFKLLKKNISKKKAIIETSLVNSENAATKLKYILYRKGDEWFIVNVVAKGVSDLSLKRADYMQFLESNSLGKLAKKLEARAKKNL